MVSVGATRTRHVLELVDDAQAASAAALLLAPVSYQPLRADEVFDLFAEVDRHVSVPLCPNDNPATTHFAFSHELYRDVARLTSVQAIKVPAPPAEQASTRIPQLPELIGSDAVVGVSGDALAAASLLAGSPAWFSVIGGLLPEAALAITRAAQARDATAAIEASDRLGGFWEPSRPTAVCGSWPLQPLGWGSRKTSTCRVRCARSTPRRVPGSTTNSTRFYDERGRLMRLLTPPRSGARMQRSVAACLAAILEIAPGEVPIPDERHPEPWTVWGQWLALRGLGSCRSTQRRASTGRGRGWRCWTPPTAMAPSARWHSAPRPASHGSRLTGPRPSTRFRPAT
jgi:hypothetical protein